MIVKKDNKNNSQSVVPIFKNRYLDAEELKKPLNEQNQTIIRSAR